jgi:predicted nucleic acid-binding protein
MYLLDTNVLIDVQRGYTPALMWFATLSELSSVPGVVVMELVQDAKNMQQVRQALRLSVYPQLYALLTSNITA